MLYAGSMKKILFVCLENSCRSQMAEAFGHMLGKGVVEVYSVGSRPSGKVSDKAIISMKEVGYNLSSHISKSLHDIPQIEYDILVTMGCGEECPSVRAKLRQDWNIPDPKHMEMKQFGNIRDLIKNKVNDLLRSIKFSTTAST